MRFLSVYSKPLIRWAGSKRKLLPILKEKKPREFNRYVEPFCGSASLFFELATDKSLLADINEELINALIAIRDDEFIRDKLISIPVSKESYYHIRSMDPSALSLSERAVRFLFLNRYCFNGVYRTNKNGKFNVPMGTKTGGFPSQESFDIARAKLEHSDIIVSDYKQILGNLREGDFVYIDPPYSKSGRFTGEYGVGSFNSDEIPEFLSVLENLSQKKVKFMLSYKACEDITSLLNESYHVDFISVKRHVSGFKSKWGAADEILVRNY